MFALGLWGTVVVLIHKRQYGEEYSKQGKRSYLMESWQSSVQEHCGVPDRWLDGYVWPTAQR